MSTAGSSSSKSRMSSSRSSSSTPGRVDLLLRLGEHGRRTVDPDHLAAGLERDGNRDTAVADGELDNRALGLLGQLDVERTSSVMC